MYGSINRTRGTIDRWITIRRILPRTICGIRAIRLHRKEPRHRTNQCDGQRPTHAVSVRLTMNCCPQGRAAGLFPPREAHTSTRAVEFLERSCKRQSRRMDEHIYSIQVQNENPFLTKTVWPLCQTPTGTDHHPSPSILGGTHRKCAGTELDARITVNIQAPWA